MGKRDTYQYVVQPDYERMLEIGVELGRLDEWSRTLQNRNKWEIVLGDDGYGVFQDLCLLFMEYEELTRVTTTTTWGLSLLASCSG